MEEVAHNIYPPDEILAMVTGEGLREGEYYFRPNPCPETHDQNEVAYPLVCAAEPDMCITGTAQKGWEGYGPNWRFEIVFAAGQSGAPLVLEPLGEAERVAARGKYKWDPDKTFGIRNRDLPKIRPPEESPVIG